MTTQYADSPGSEIGIAPAPSEDAGGLRAVDHRDAIRTSDPLIRLGGLTLEFVARIVTAPMAMFLIAEPDRRCSLAEMRVDPILTSEPQELERECAGAIAETVPCLGLPDRFRHHLLLDRDGLELLDGFTGSAFADRFMPAWGLEEILVLLMKQEETGTTCVVALLRAVGEEPFRDREKGFLRQVAPLLSQSWNCATVPGGGSAAPAYPGLAEAGLASLTRRELEIARLAAGGAVNEEIAQLLNITVGTVKCHIRSVYAKLGIHSRVRLSLLLAGA